MRVLCDIHHEELFESLRILFEDRLGHELYRPVGIEWWEEKYWCLGSHFSLEKQLSAATQHLYMSDELVFRKLKPGERLVGNSFVIRQDKDIFLRYVTLFSKKIDDGIYEVKSPLYGDQTYRGITLERFKETPFDILISSVPDHVDSFNRLIQLYQPTAKHIFQAGNPWPPPTDKVKNILSSTVEARTDKAHCVYYHQEFDLNLFRPGRQLKNRSIASMMHYLEDFDIFLDLENSMSDWKFNLYGANCRDGVLGPKMADIAATYAENSFLWHVKREGEGYGYNIHHALAMGIPVIVRKHHFTGQTVDPLLVDGLTCIDLDNKSTEEVKKTLIKAFDDYDNWSSNTYTKFKSLVDFDREEEEIRKFIENLK